MPDEHEKNAGQFDSRPTKYELLTRFFKEEGIPFNFQQILRRRSSTPPPLSFGQERLWFLDQLEPGNHTYNIYRAYRIAGPLNLSALSQSLNEIVRRHEILRTTFLIVGDRPVQTVASKLTLSVAVVDLANLPVTARDTEVSRVLSQEARYSFDLAAAPLLRLGVVRLDHDNHIIVFTAHQIVCDGWSIRLFFEELTELYQAITEARLVRLPELSIQYGDYAAWQRERIRGPFLKRQLSYWKDRLGGIIPVLKLPTDRPNPPVQTFSGSRHAINLPSDIRDVLRALGQRHRTTLFVTLIAAFNALIYRYTAQEDIVVGFPCSNRSLKDLEILIGSFVNTLLLRSNLAGNASFVQLLVTVRDGCREALEHQDIPFEMLVQELQPERDMSRNPLFQVMFSFQNKSAAEVKLPINDGRAIEVKTGTSKVELSLSLVEREDGLDGHFEYNTDMFDASTIERISGNFETLLGGIVADPHKRLSDLPLLTGTERHQLLIRWNATQFDYPEDKSVHQLFEAQADATPEAIALVFEDKEVSYGELNKRANQLAHYLSELGVGYGTLVAVCLERSLDLMVGLLGVLKAGGAYVPLDPLFPKERLAFMLQDAQVSILLTQHKFYQSLSLLSASARFVRLDRDWEEIATQRDDNRPTKVPSDNLAYAIYTSGSAGKPKAVQVSHRSVVNCLYSIRQAVGFTENDTLLALTTISFDIAALELFLPLLSGARIAFANRDKVLDGKQLANRLASSAATVMQGTPSTWRLLLNASWQGVEGFKILCGGEVLTRSLANDLLDGGASLWNLYGPTETTIWSTAAKIEPGEDPVLIGRPLGNTRIYILDSYLQPVPVGVHGELYIGGDGVARGYLNQPELTREKFVPDIFSDQADARLYRTGDLARYRPDGNIEFLGRIDNQVKIRGHRIELGEIEFVLNQHPAVKESVVIAHDRGPAEEKDLVGYIVPYQGSAISVSNLRTALSQKLPAFMIPSAFVVLDALPLTPNGKVDRSKLVPPDDTRPCLDQVCVEPRSEIEELVAQVWREALKLEKIGVFDNFFELGGHSILATRVIVRLRNNFNIDLALRKLFELPTIAGLAEHVDFMRRNQSGTGIPPIVAVSRDRPVPLSFAQRRLWFFHKLEPESPAYNIPAIFRIKGPLSSVVLEKALSKIVSRHEVLRTRIIESDGEPFQQIPSCVTLTLSVIDVSHLPEGQIEAEVNRLSAEDARRAFNLEEAPLMRSKLLRLKQDEHVLILNFHHIVCDGSSLAIFYNELATVYQSLLDDKPVALPPLCVQYADYSVWQEKRLKESLESQLAYWKRQLGTGSMAPSLPTDHPRPAMQTYNGKRVTRLLSADLTKALIGLSRTEGVTLFMTLLASLDIVLSRHTGEKDIVVGSTMAGRNRPEVDGLIGFFINALALRVDLSGNPTFQDLLKRVREVCLDAYSHQELPFEKVVEEINPERDPSRNPLFQVMFNMADVSQRTLTLPGCKVTKVSAVEPSAKFDIVLHAPEINGSVELAMVYNADLFEESTITVLLDELSWLLSQIAQKPNSNIHEYSLLTPSAQAILPNAAEPLDSAWRGAIHTLVANQADRVPEQSAVIDADERWTYSELDSQSGQLANYLIEGGIQPKDIVAIYAHRSGPLVLSLLGILKAGAAFTIIDPAYPATRLLQYLRIARPKGWVEMTAAGELGHELDNFLDDPHFRCRISLPKSKPAIAGFLAEYSKIEPRGRTVSADDPAYVAFTSGSTGEPKGVLGKHGPITHFLPWQNERFDLRKSDRFCLLSGLGYNHLQRDVFTALALGTTLYIPAPDLMKSPERLIEWLDRREITILHLTPALARLLLTVAGKTLASVRRVFSGGDLLTSHDVSSIQELAPNAKIVSFYGATETQRAVGYFEIPEDISKSQRQPNRPIPLGRGAKDVQLLLLNPGGQLAGVGELSELYMRSPHLAHGYMADDDLTAHNFIKNPFTNDTGDRLYRTGDLGRYLPDGNVEWAGRKDRRASIRGFRVELAEIEATLNQHGAVTNSAVIARELIKAGEPTELRLFAYVESQQGRSLCAEELRCFLSDKLPSYMQPAHIVIVDHLPLNPNGKVDFLKLSEPNLLLLSGHEEFEAPHSPIEKALAKIFTEVLGIERIGRQQNFFHLGGHSLLAAQVITRLKEGLNVALDLRTFLETPTVEGLARQVEALQTAVETTQRARDIEREEIEI